VYNILDLSWFLTFASGKSGWFLFCRMNRRELIGKNYDMFYEGMPHLSDRMILP